MVRRNDARLLGEGGFAGAIDHRTENVAARLDELCPDGIDVYFDNVGGPMLDLALARLRNRGRIVLCGVTSCNPSQRAPDWPPGLSAADHEERADGGPPREGLLRPLPRSDPGAAGLARLRVSPSKEDILVGLKNAPKGLARFFPVTMWESSCSTSPTSDSE